jgi:hypothetical protein
MSNVSTGIAFLSKDHVVKNRLCFSVMHFFQLSVTFCYWINFLSRVRLSASSGLDFSSCMQQQSPSYETQSSKKFPVAWWIRLFVRLLTAAHTPFSYWTWQSTLSHTTPLELIWIHPSSLHLFLVFTSSFFPAGCHVPILFALIFLSRRYMPYPSRLS